MEKTLVKFKHIEESTNSFIEAVYHFNPVQTIQLLKEVTTIRLDDDYYEYCSCEYVPTDQIGAVNVVNVYVASYEN